MTLQAMELPFRHRFQHLCDKEIVNRVLSDPQDERAAIYLIYDRYEPLCISICQKTFGNTYYLDELQCELYMLLKGTNRDWHALKSFGWKSTFGTWLRIVCYNLSLELRRQLIENDGNNTSLDNGWEQENRKSRPIDISVDEEKEQERRYNMALLNEAIHRLKNSDQRFVVIQRLKGYSSKEVAEQLKVYWTKNNIKRLNHKKERVIPDSGYIDNLFKRGYDKVSDIYKMLNK